MVYIRNYHLFSVLATFFLFTAILPSETKNHNVVTDLSNWEINTLDKNLLNSDTNESYIYLGKELSNASELIFRMSELDDAVDSPLHQLKDYIEEGFLFVETKDIINVIKYAQSIIHKKHNPLERNQENNITNELETFIHQIASGALSTDQEMITRKPDFVINDDLVVFGQSTFYKHVRTKQGIHISGKLKVAKSATFKKNVKIKGTLSVEDATIDNLTSDSITAEDVAIENLSATNAIIQNLSVVDLLANNVQINGALSLNDVFIDSLSVNDVVINDTLQILSFTSPGVLHNDALGNISSSLIVDVDITDGTITNQKLATASSDNIPGYLVLRDGLGNFATNMVTLEGTVTNPTDAATKAYVDSVVTTGVVPKTPAVVISLTNQALIGLPVIDGVALSANDRVLLNGQTDPVENGLWVADVGAWSRPADFASGTNAGSAYVLILSGTVNGGSSWLCNTPSAIIDTDPISFILFSLASTTNGANVGVGTGLIFKNKTGNTLNFKSLIQGSHIVITNNIDDITLATDGTSANTPNTLVARNASGNFSAGNISIVDAVASGNLILSPSTATTGNILKGPNRFIHNFGTDNTFVGIDAGNFITSGAGQNSAFGRSALTAITTGSNNIAIGFQAGQIVTTGSGNIYINANAASGAENNTIRIGSSQTNTFIAGISNTGVSGDAVSIDANGQLGITFSSKRFKHSIENMGSMSEKILNLRPVTFVYNNSESNMQEFGLIAEEVEETFPAIVAKDKSGLPYTVRYHLLPVLLLNELQKQNTIIQQQQITIEKIQNALAALQQVVQECLIR